MKEFIQNADTLKRQFTRICHSEKGIVFTEDIKKMIGITENDEDIDLLISLIKRYSMQKKLVVFQGYSFGPQVMRLLYIKNKPDVGVALMEDKDLYPNFHQFSTVLLLLDMLFNNQMYEKIIEFYEQHYGTYKKLSSVRCTLLFLAACYKLNTKESFEKAINAYMTCFSNITKGKSMRCSLFIAAFAIKQNQPSYAVEFFSSNKIQSLPKNFNCMAYAQAKRFDDIFFSIKAILNGGYIGNFFLTEEAISFIEKEIRTDPSGEEYISEFETLKEELNNKNIIVQEPLDKFLFEEITFRRKLQKSQASVL